MSEHDPPEPNEDDETEPTETWTEFDLLPRTKEEARKREAIQRFMDLERMLYHLYSTRPISDPNMYPIPPETLEPDYMGPEEDGFPSFDEDPALLLADIGRLIAALGGHLELRAVFPETTITLLIEPGPEHLHDHD